MPGSGIVERDSSGRRTILVLVLAMVAGLVGGALVVVAWELFRGDDSSASHSSASPSTCDVVGIASSVLPSVVTLSVSQRQGQGTGSGVIVRSPLRQGDDKDSSAASPTGTIIVTNQHVVAPGGTPGKVLVTYADGETSPAAIVGTDEVTDLAVVRPEELPSHVRAVEIGSAADLRVGQQVVALGAPLGLSSTVTTGIVSATDRYVRVPSSSGSTHHLVGAVQTDAAINPGNSGGALVDCEGALVGINSAGASPPGDSGSVGLNFAIPSTLFVPLANELITSGRVRHPTLGMQVAPISPELAKANGVSAGLFVQAVSDGGPAQKAGIRPDDVVVDVDGKAMHSPDDLTQLELSTDPGDSVKVTLERAGQRATVTVVAAE
jgi:putative serine protease PepD